MYARDRIRAALLWAGGILAVGVCAALIVFFVWTLNLKTAYRADCLEINDAILASPAETNLVHCGGETYPASDALVQYYNVYLLARDTTVYSRKASEHTDRTITIELAGGSLSLTELDDPSAVAIEWKTPEHTKTYLVRNSAVTFLQLRSYFTNYKNRMDAGSAA